MNYYIKRLFKKLSGSAIMNSIIDKTAKIEAGSLVINSQFGRYSYCGNDCSFVNVSCGNFCSISNFVKIGGGTHPQNWVSTSPAFYYGRDSISKRLANLRYDYSDKKTIIGNDVWIGYNVIIKSGVHIGDGAIIGMGSVVTHDVQPYSIVGGNPARELRKRFDEKTIERLMDIKWWTFSDEDIAKISDCFDDPNTLFERIDKNV